MADIIDGLYSWVSFLPRITKTNLVEIIIIAILLYELLVWICLLYTSDAADE